MATLEVEVEVEVEVTEEWKSWGQGWSKEVRWCGWFAQDDVQNEMIFDTFEIQFDNSIYGRGFDAIGTFTIAGALTGSDVTFDKTYDGAHTVSYTGTLTDGLSITGDWQIPDNCAGTFCINADLQDWTGWFDQSDERTEMQLKLDIDQFGVYGGGFDAVGSFLIRGSMDSSGTVNFAKYYYGAHVVLYRGNWTETNFTMTITGAWEIPGNCGGNFCLTPSLLLPETIPSSFEGWGENTDLTVPWTGHFIQDGTKTEMFFSTMTITLSGTILGSGSDSIGSFTISGTLQPNSELSFIKQYTDAHAVNYNGSLSSRGTIKGSWEIPETCAGEFRITMLFEKWKGFFIHEETKNKMK